MYWKNAFRFSNEISCKVMVKKINIKLLIYNQIKKEKINYHKTKME